MNSTTYVAAMRTLRLCAATLVCLALATCSNSPSEPAAPPVLTPIGAKSVMEGDLLTFGVTAQGGGGAWPA